MVIRWNNPQGSSIGMKGRTVWRSAGLIEEAILKEVIQGGYSVMPADLLSFRIRAAVVDDRNLVDAGTDFR